MKKKMGRPPIVEGQSKDVLVGVRVSDEEQEQINHAAAQSGESKSEWVRNAAIAESKRPQIWVKSKWKYDELKDKLVEFRLTAQKFWVEGIGQFLVRVNPEGKLAIEIRVSKAPTPYKIIETRYWIGQEAADLIELHPNPKVAAFRLLG